MFVRVLEYLSFTDSGLCSDGNLEEVNDYHCTHCCDSSGSWYSTGCSSCSSWCSWSSIFIISQNPGPVFNVSDIPLTIISAMRNSKCSTQCGSICIFCMGVVTPHTRQTNPGWSPFEPWLKHGRTSDARSIVHYPNNQLRGSCCTPL